MAAHGSPPFFHVEDANGNPYVSAKLYVYDAGTTTLKSIYSDTALSAALSNPLTSDASGNFSRFYLATGTYKVRAETSSETLIWQFDNVDTGLPAGTGALPVASGGTGGTTAAAARTNLDVPSNSELTTLSSTISDLQSTIQSLVSAPQGRLTLTTATPVISTGVTAGTAVYYTPFIGNIIPIYDGAQFNARSFSELTLTLHSNHVANSIYDVFVFYDTGAVTIGTGPAWNTATAGSGARGSGAGTTELERKNGLWTNKNSMTTRNGATTYTVDANEGTFVGSIFIDGTNGQISCLPAWGASRKWGVSNAYNTEPIMLKAGDSTASWTYATNTARASNNATTNKLTTFCCLPEQYIKLEFKQKVLLVPDGGTNGNSIIGIGKNSTSAFSGLKGEGLIPNGGASTGMMLVSEFMDVPAIGINNYTSLEQVVATGSSNTFYGTESNMTLTAQWMG